METFLIFFLPNIISVFRLTYGAARFPLFYSLPTKSPYGWGLLTSQREREVEEKEDKSPKNQFAKARTPTHDLSLLSWVLYPLDHGAKPETDGEFIIAHLITDVR